VIGFLLVIVCLAILVAVVIRVESDETRNRILLLLCGAYMARIGIQFLLEGFVFFSHGTSTGLRGDSATYESQGALLAKVWDRIGIQWMGDSPLLHTGRTVLPAHIFGVIIFLNGGKSLIGCVSVVAMLACFTGYILYRLSLALGAKETSSFRILALMMFSPGFLLYTSDTSKDGLVAFFAIGAIASAIRLAMKFQVFYVMFGAFCLLCLWHTRYYLLFLIFPPLVVGLQGIKSRSIMRPLAMSFVFIFVIMIVALATDFFNSTLNEANRTFEVASAGDVLESNATGGSGVRFDDGGNPFGAFHLKLLYTLFSPFPWMSGSVGLQIGKLDTLVWYYMAYRMVVALRTQWKEQGIVFLMVLLFVIPTLIAYATTVSNVGLIYRQRIPLVFLGYFIASLGWREHGDTNAHNDEESAYEESQNMPVGANLVA
jgi:hypothetical protein